jgi:hypothetical protein
MFTELMERRAKLTRQRDEAEVELTKMKQLIQSVFAMLSEDQQKANQQAIDDMEAESGGIQDAIKLVFSKHQGDWLTVSNVRDYLIDIGFDFRRYKANPLASIGTTLKRMADTNYVESKPSGSGAMIYVRHDPLYKLAAPGSAALERFKQAHKTRYVRGQTVPPVPDHVEDAMKETFKKK